LDNISLITIILPIRNEAAYIERCLGAILTQDYPGQMEVLIVDGISTDDTRAIIRRVDAQHATLRQTQDKLFRVQILDNPGKIVPIGMNIAFCQAKGDIIVRVDGHCIIAPDYVRKCVKHIQADGMDGVGGPMETIGETALAQLIAIGMSSPFGVGNSAFRTLSGKSMLADTVPFPAYTRAMIERAGLYDEELVRNQDDEYNYRIRELGGKILLAADVQSTYFSRASLQGLWKQYYQYGFWKVRVLQKHPRQMSIRQFVPPLFVLALILSVVLSFSSVFRPLSLVVPILYLFANLAASILTAFRTNKSNQSPITNYYLLLPFTFAILHISYGLGFLAGLMKFWNRWGDKTGKTPAWQGESGG
jgi:glycosyltransferase involved in cell wall biosynthesis